MARKYKFPQSDEVTKKDPAVMCPADRVLELYNQDHEKDAARISKKVRTWFTEQAHENGWDGVRFLPEVQSGHGAGCVLWKDMDQTHTLVLIEKAPEDPIEDFPLEIED